METEGGEQIKELILEEGECQTSRNGNVCVLVTQELTPQKQTTGFGRSGNICRMVPFWNESSRTFSIVLFDKNKNTNRKFKKKDYNPRRTKP